MSAFMNLFILFSSFFPISIYDFLVLVRRGFGGEGDLGLILLGNKKPERELFSQRYPFV